MSKATRKRRGNVVEQMVDEMEAAQIDAVIAAWRRGEMGSDEGKAVLARALARCEARASAGKAA